jgi:L-glyceraldehyde 3-phosphate reductase
LNDRYQHLPYRRCGRSGLDLSAISLGLWQNCTEDAFVKELCTAAFDQGVTHFDLANNYGPPPGQAETCFGSVMRGDLKAHRDELIIASKAGYNMWAGPYGDWGSRKYLIASCDQSLKRMGLDYVDIFYHHRPDPRTPLEETLGALEQLVRSGKAIYVGISNYDGRLCREAARIAKDMRLPLIINQVSFSLLNRGPETDLLPRAEEAGVGVIAFSPLSQGLLTDRYLNGIPADSRIGKNSPFLKSDRITAELLAKLNKLNEVAKSRNQNLAQMALSWLLHHRQVVSVIVGVSKIAQLHDNLAAAKAPAFSSEQIIAINAALA